MAPHLVRETALVAHALPHAEVRCSLADGRTFTVASEPPALMTPCLFRAAVVQHAQSEAAASWVASLVAVEFSSRRCRHLGAGLYAAWCAGRAVCAFTSEVDAHLLCVAVSQLPEGAASVRVVPDTELGLSLLAIESDGTFDEGELVDVARGVQSAVLVTEMECLLRAS